MSIARAMAADSDGSSMVAVEAGIDDMLRSAPKYYWGCCMVCKKGGVPSCPLKRCAGCSAAFYCSKDHQKLHWKTHKRICNYLKAAADEVGADTFFGKEMIPVFMDQESDTEDKNEDDACDDNDKKTANWKSWALFRVNAAKMCQVILTGGEGSLEEWEKEMFLFPRACRVCRLAKKDGMYDCPDCMCVSYCSLAHRQADAADHVSSGLCMELKYAMVCDVYESTVSIAAPAIASDIETLFSKDKFLKHDIKSFLLSQSSSDWSRNSTLYKKAKKIKYKDIGDFDTDEMDFRFLTDRLSGPLTILYGCLSTNQPLASGVTITEARDLTVHIVGCNVVEMLGIIKWEYLLHRLPQLENYRVVFVGPELDDHGETEDGECVDINACQNCQQHGKSLVYEVRRTTYQQYVEKGQEEGFFTYPDVVVAFNCGFHEFPKGSKEDTWRAGIQLLVREVGVPLIFTSYTKTEAEKDMAVFKDSLDDEVVSKVDFDVEGALNPFRSHRPVRDFELDNQRDVFYANQFIAVARRTSQ